MTKNEGLLKFYVFLWRLILPRPTLKMLGLSYHHVCKKLLNLSGINDVEKSFILQRKLFKRYKISFDIAKTTQRIMYFHYKYENEVMNLLKHVLAKGYTFVDVGAHIGYFSFLASHLVTDTGRVYAFEPHPNNFQMLCKNISNNDVKNVYPEKLALSNQNGYEKFYFHELNEGGGSIENIDQRADSYISAKKFTFDDFYFSNIQNVNIDFVKIDVEGHECKVLLGMEKTIERDHPFILAEVLDKRKESEIINILKKFGYKCFIKITKYDLFCSVDLKSISIKPYHPSISRSLKTKLFN